MMRSTVSNEVYTAREIALAAGVGEDQVIAALGSAEGFVPHEQALAVARALRGGTRLPPPTPFSRFGSTLPVHQGGLTWALSGTVHLIFAGVLILLTTMGFQSSAKAVQIEPQRSDAMRLVYLATPGPGGGGGGGGRLQRTPPPKALREGRKTLSSPLPVRDPAPVQSEPVTPPPLRAESLPQIVAPVASAPADQRDRTGILEQARAQQDSNGSGSGAGVGSGRGTGIGEGSGPGIGPGSGGGIGGGPYRPGSGIEPPRLLKEIKPDYPDEARRRGLEGEVEMEIVVRQDGSVGDVKILKGLSASLDERAIQAVRQWRFSPARRLGTAVDVIVEVSVEFRMR